MAKLTIDNFGPIKNAEFELKKVNVFIGQQGEGKSCVMKIAAFCMWVEKVYLSGEIVDLQSDLSPKAFVEKYLLEFYKLADFAKISENQYSIIAYNNDGKFKININLKKNSEKWMEIVDIESILQPRRIAYIPAERSIVSTIPNLSEIKVQNTNLFKFLVDWENAHKLYSAKNKLNILGLNAEYFYDEKSRIDYLTVKDNGVETNIKMTNAASGFQSLVPIYILTNYYLNTANILSIKEKQRIDDLKKILEYYSSKMQDDVVKMVQSNINHLNNNRNCNIFLEEPEVNIFPDIQYRLIKFLFSTLNNGYDNTLSIATHSPYILTVIDNLIYAAKVGKIRPEKVKEIVLDKEWMPIENVSAYYLNNGKVLSIIDDELGEIDPALIDKISHVINHEYDLIRDIEYETEEHRRTA